jgi:glycerol kinase
LIKSSFIKGAAMVAGRAINKWDVENIVVEINSKKFKPKISEDERDLRYTKWKMAIDRSLGWDN